jgi:hypothetical protein
MTELEIAWGFNARCAAKIKDILQGLDPKIESRSKDVAVRLKRADPAQAMWTFTANGSKGESYTIRVKGLKSGKLVNVDVRVACDCDFFRWQGPEHWAKVNDYLYGKPVGAATAPTNKDPNGKNRLCKHAVAALDMAKAYIAE